MLKQFSRFYTVGWNQEGKLSVIPVITKEVEIKPLYLFDKQFSRYVEQTPFQCAENMNATLANVARIFTQEYWNTDRNISRGFCVENGFVRSPNVSGAREAIVEIMMELYKQEKPCLTI